MFDESHLERVLLGIGVTHTGELYHDLQTTYGGTNRHYHNQQHIDDCLTHFQPVRMLAQHPDEVEIALWFHDAIYDSRKSDNEEQSADWARRFLQSQGTAGDIIDRIGGLILATKTHSGMSSIDQQLMIDVDLRILGEVPEVFETYDRGIRAEYDWVPLDEYLRGRAAVLKTFLDRQTIFQTVLFQTRYEQSARENLRRKIAELLATMRNPHS
ncbi:MAG: N-methyl-D-aspartate receptor NMDAR2C subunit [Planctomycetaceae bacterium]